MPKPGLPVTACVEIPKYGEPECDKRGRVIDPSAPLPIIGTEQIEGPAVVLCENADGTVDVAIYDNAPDEKPDTHSRLVCGGSHLKQSTSPSDRGPGRWWV